MYTTANIQIHNYKYINIHNYKYTNTQIYTKPLHTLYLYSFEIHLLDKFLINHYTFFGPKVSTTTTRHKVKLQILPFLSATVSPGVAVGVGRQKTTTTYIYAPGQIG